jgi:hypothetical protein
MPLETVIQQLQTLDLIILLSRREEISADAPPYLTILPMIDSWRQHCKELDVPFFAFTVSRNPSKLAMFL